MEFSISCPSCGSIETECNTHCAWCYDCDWMISSTEPGFVEFRSEMSRYRESVASAFDELLVSGV